jgi:uncharacterized membrane-anchored protein
MKTIEPVLLLLAGLLVLFTFLLLWCSVVLKTDGQTFQVISSLVTGFAGALLMRIKPRGQADKDEPEVKP